MVKRVRPTGNRFSGKEGGEWEMTGKEFMKHIRKGNFGNDVTYSKESQVGKPTISPFVVLHKSDLQKKLDILHKRGQKTNKSTKPVVKRKKVVRRRK